MNFRTILHPTDFSELSQTALRYAAEMAHDHGAELVIIHAVETLGPENVTYGEAISQPQPEMYRQRLWNDLRQIKPPREDIQVEYVLSEKDAAEAILEIAAQRHCDLIVMGSHGRTGLKRLLMGSLAEEVVRKAPCPVLVVKRPPTGQLLEPAVGTEQHPNFLNDK